MCYEDESTFAWSARMLQFLLWLCCILDAESERLTTV